jgi:hypothetical protein
MLLKTAGSALALALVVGCASNKSTSSATLGASPAAALTVATVVGEYTLVTVDGNALPHAPRAVAGTMARPVVSGSLLINPNGTFRLETAYGADSGPSAAATGTCYAEDDAVKMVWDGGGLTNLTLRGDTVLLKREGSEYRYLPKR